LVSTDSDQAPTRVKTCEGMWRACGAAGAIEALPERYRAPLLLRYYADMSYEEIGASLRLPRSQVATLIFRAKKELRRKLAPAERELRA